MAEIGTDLGKAAELLKSGELVAMPTETVYGLAANAMNNEAVLKIFSAKQRPHFDPLIVHIHHMDQLGGIAAPLSAKALKLANHFWPGALTLVLPKLPAVPDLVTSGLDTVAVRMPRHPMAQALLRSLEFPLAAPSANPFGYVSPTTAVHVANQLGSEVRYILDGGPCEVGLESTIVSFSGSTPMVLRPGGISVEAIADVIGPVEVAPHGTDNPTAPGMLASHYATGIPMVVGDVAQLVEANTGRQFAVLGWQHTHGFDGIALSPKGNLEEAAARLFAAMRELDQRKDIDLIIAEKLPPSGLGLAINDRIQRASFNKTGI